MHRHIRIIHFNLTPEVHDQLVALSYHTGHKGTVSWVVKPMIQKAIKTYLGGLSPRDRKVYDEILENVKIGAAMKPPPKWRKSTYVKKKLRGGV